MRPITPGIRSAGFALFVEVTAIAADGQTASKLDDRSGLSERMAKLNFIYEADQTTAEFIRSHLVVAGHFFRSGETKSHWLGSVQHPQDNTSPTSYYVTTGVAKPGEFPMHNLPSPPCDRRRPPGLDQ